MIIALIHGLYGFTFSYLSIPPGRYHLAASIWHGFILILLWSTHTIVADNFVTRDFIGPSQPFIEPALGPLGPLFVLYAGLATLNGMRIWVRHKRTNPKYRNTFLAILRDMTDRKRAEEERESLIVDLKGALTKVKTLRGLLPICASCKKIRDDKGYWNRIEGYIKAHSDADFTHSICPDCAKKLYPDLKLFSEVD